MTDEDLFKNARTNHLLRVLKPDSLASLAPEMQVRTLSAREPVIRRGETIERVFFPLSCVLSTVAHGSNAELVEVAAVGNEGMAGVSVYLGISCTPTLETFIQIPGDALALSAEAFRAQIAKDPSLAGVLGHYTQALLTQIAQASACNRMHPAEQRCARWLLMTHDRVQRDEFELTQSFLAQMLGVRRATVGEIAGALQQAGIIRYVRGRMVILNRGALEERACECYRIIRDEYNRLLPPPSATAASPGAAPEPITM